MLNGNAAIVLRWNGQEEWYTGFRHEEYRLWLIETYADANLVGLQD